MGREVCASHTICRPGSKVIKEPTSTTDRKCEKCTAGLWSNKENAERCEAIPEPDCSLEGKFKCDEYAPLNAGECVLSCTTDCPGYTVISTDFKRCDENKSPSTCLALKQFFCPGDAGANGYS